MHSARQTRRLHTIAPLLTLALAGAAASAQVADCCTDVRWKASPAVDMPSPIKVCQSDGYLYGSFCFPFGTAFGCGVQSTLTVGQSFALNAGFSAGGVEIGAATTFSVSEAFAFTSGVCQRCRLFAQYRGGQFWPSLRFWSCEVFYGFWSFNMNHVIFKPNGGAIVRPCCEVDNTCPGCPRPPAESGASPGCGDDHGTEGDSEEPVDPGDNFDGPSVFIFELAGSFVTNGEVPSGHPILNGGSHFDSLNQWHRCQIMQLVQETEAETGQVFGELIVRDPDGTPHFVDLVSNPRGLCQCEIDYNDDGFLDATDINAFVNFFQNSDGAADLAFDRIFDLNDVIRFVQLFTTNCEGRLDP